MTETNETTTSTQKVLNSRSKTITEGGVRAPNRSMLRAVGLTDEDFNKPLIGVASTWSEITPCNSHINRLAEKVREGVRVGGGIPQIFGTITVSDGISMGTVIGPNGSGKTTVFNLITGFLAKDGGDVRFNGQSIAGSVEIESTVSASAAPFNSRESSRG